MLLATRTNPEFFRPATFVGYALAGIMVPMGIATLVRGKGWGPTGQVEIDDGRDGQGP